MSEAPGARGRLGKILVAFAAIYLIWGSTFLAIHVALADLPPVFLCAVRLLSAGAILVAWARVRGETWPQGREWLNAALVGILLPAFGNTSVTIAETHLPSGLVALFLATIPLWVALLSALGRDALRPGPLAVFGLVLGFTGVALLLGPALSDPQHSHISPLWALIPLAGAFSWAWGTQWSRRAAMPRSPMMATAIGLLAGGAVMSVLSVAAGELARIQPAHVGGPTLIAMSYLVVFGSVFAFTCYLFLLRVVSPALVSTYAFVNPIVAMALGWAFAREALSGRTLAAAALVLASVVLITVSTARTSGSRARIARSDRT